jgi:4-hydroxybenzoate polyprenyltransferase
VWTSWEELAVADAAVAVTDERGALARVVAFVIERYPPIPQVVLVVTLWLAGLAMAATMWAPARGVTPGHVDVAKLVLSGVGALLFVFHLRVFDDVKDADTDRTDNPTRPIPRGLVSEREVDALSVVLLAVEALLFAGIGPLAFTVWVIAAAFTVLMRVEFFVGSWLERHVLTYAASHMWALALVLASLVAAGIETLHMRSAANLGNVVASADILVACIAAFVLGVGFELGRKFERYAAAHGVWAWVLWIATPVAGTVLMVGATWHHYATWVTIALAAVAVVVGAASVVLMARRPDPTPTRENAWPKGMRETVEALPGLAGLLTYLVLAVAGVQALSF